MTNGFHVPSWLVAKCQKGGSYLIWACQSPKPKKGRTTNSLWAAKGKKNPEVAFCLVPVCVNWKLTPSCDVVPRWWNAKELRFTEARYMLWPVTTCCEWPQSRCHPAFVHVNWGQDHWQIQEYASAFSPFGSAWLLCPTLICIGDQYKQLNNNSCLDTFGDGALWC